MESTPKPFIHCWRCVECCNSVKHFLGICWKCGAVRPGGEVARQASLESEREILACSWSAREDAFKDFPTDLLDRLKRDIQRQLRRIDLARSIVLSITDHVEGVRLVRRLGTLISSTEERSDATFLSDYYGEGYHGELHHADDGELVVFMLMYKAHQLGANAVLNVTLTPPPPNSYGHVASGEAALIEDVVT
jgi:uncharacterized protein YbjQ (UPF0145 family)